MQIQVKSGARRVMPLGRRLRDIGNSVPAHVQNARFHTRLSAAYHKGREKGGGVNSRRKGGPKLSPGGFVVMR
jgi:hypothetical protein